MDPVVSACIYSSAQVSTAVELLPARVLVNARVQCLHADTFMFHLDYAAIRTQAAATTASLYQSQSTRCDASSHSWN